MLLPVTTLQNNCGSLEFSLQFLHFSLPSSSKSMNFAALCSMFRSTVKMLQHVPCDISNSLADSNTCVFMDKFLNSGHIPACFAGTHPKHSALSTDHTSKVWKPISRMSSTCFLSTSKFLTLWRFMQQFWLIWTRIWHTLFFRAYYFLQEAQHTVTFRKLLLHNDAY